MKIMVFLHISVYSNNIIFHLILWQSLRTLYYLSFTILDGECESMSTDAQAEAKFSPQTLICKELINCVSAD